MEDKLIKFMEKNSPYKYIGATVLIAWFFIALINYKVALGIILGTGIISIAFLLMTWVLVYNDYKNNW